MMHTFAQYAARLSEFIEHAADVPATTRAAETEAEFNQLALLLFGLQFQNNLPYRKLCEARSQTPGGVQHWRQIPAAPAAAFKTLELTSLSESERSMVFHSSGTTERQPSRHFHNRESIAIYEKSLLPWFRSHLLPEFDPCGDPTRPRLQFVSLTPPASAAPHSSLVHMFETVHRAFGSSDSFFAGRLTGGGDWTLDVPLLTPRLARRRGPVVLLGTAFNFVQLADELDAESLGLSLPAGSRVLETGGYKGRSRSLSKAELHTLIAGRLGIASDHIIREYGMCELSAQAYDCKVAVSGAPRQTSRWFRFSPWARAQIISPETGREVADGETGLIRVLDLANVRSVLAVQTEDLGVRRGDGFELIGRAGVSEARGCSLMTV